MQTGDGYLLLGQPELAELTMRALELKGDLPQLIDPRFQLGLTVDDWTRSEYAWLRRQRLGQCAANVAASALNFNTVYVFVAANTPTLTVVTQILISNPNAAAATFRYALSNSPLLVSTFAPLTRDNRSFTALPGSLCGLNQAAAAVLPVSAATITLAPGAAMAIPTEYVLGQRVAPNGFSIGLVVETAIINSAVNVVMDFRERAALTPEF